MPNSVHPAGLEVAQAGKLLIKQFGHGPPVSEGKMWAALSQLALVLKNLLTQT